MRRVLFGLSLVFLALGFHQSARAESVPGQIIIQLKSKGSEKNIIHQLQGVLGDENLLDFEPLLTDPTVHKITLAGDQKTSEAIDVLQQNEAVEFAEPNFIFHSSKNLADFTPNDPEFKNQWALKNPLQLGVDIGITRAWESGYTGSKKVVVAIIDTGIDYDHPDLKNNIYINPNELAQDGRDNDSNGFVDDIHGWNFVNNTNDARDDNDHGTHCAGIIGAIGNNAQGVAGVNWNVSILPLKFLDQDGSGSLDRAIEAVRYAQKMKVQVMSNSWGGSDYSAILEKVIKDVKKAGILFVAAAGNERKNNDETPSYPASYAVDNVVSVGALDQTGSLAWFSNYGRKTVHVAAPGVSILSTVRGGEYRSESGTSMACPYVAGVAALVLSAHPELNPSELRSRLMNTSQYLPTLPSRTISGGIINAYNAIQSIEPPRPTVPDPESELWKVQSVEAVASEHPYQNNTRVKFKVSHPGAKYLRIDFDRIGVELNHDYVRVFNKDQKLVQEITGSYMYLKSDVIVGDEATIEMVTDSQSVGYGFSVDEIYYVE